MVPGRPHRSPHPQPALQAVESSSRPRVWVCNAICASVTAPCTNKPVDLPEVLLKGCVGGRPPCCVWSQQVSVGLIKPAWPGKGLVKAPPVQTSIAYSPQPGARGREGSSLPEEHSPCRPSRSQSLTAEMGSRRGRPREPVCSGSVA